MMQPLREHQAQQEPAFTLALGCFWTVLEVCMVELSGIEPLTSSLRIQGMTFDEPTRDDTEQ